jgi:hypothetical protein
MSEPAQPDDPHEILWEESYTIFYDSYYEQLLAEKLLRSWYWVDVWSRLLVAVTASGSAIAAWAVWGQSGLNVVWAVVAGVAALVSVVHSVLNVSNRLKEVSETRAAFLLIRTDTEALRRRMRLNPDFPLNRYATEIERLGKMYADAESKLTVDVFRSRALENAVQVELNALIRDELQTQ